MNDANNRVTKALKKSSRAVARLLGKRGSTLETLSLIAKGFGALGAAVVAVATVVDSKPTVYVSAAVTFVSILFSLVADEKSSMTLSKAGIAIDRALERQAESERTEKAYLAELQRLSHFQAAKDLIKDILEDVLTSRTSRDEVSVIERILTQARWQLFLAFGFLQNDYHTVCVYQREETEDGEQLVLKAHVRAIDCKAKDARAWPTGVGVAGSALALRREVVVADLTSADAEAMYPIPNPRPDDPLKYRSMVAEPIGSDCDEKPWGILIATSREPWHFSQEDPTYVQVAQSLAGLISLAIKVVQTSKPILRDDSQKLSLD